MSSAGRKVSQAEKVRAALDDHLHGYSWSEVAQRNGYSNDSSACRAVSTYLRKHPSPEVEQLRQTEDLKLSLIERGLWQVVQAKHYAHDSEGNLVLDADGEPIEVTGPKVQAYNALIRLSESRRRLHGADVPVLTRISIEDDAAETAAIEVIVGELVEASTNVYPLPLPPASAGLPGRPACRSRVTRSCGKLDLVSPTSGRESGSASQQTGPVRACAESSHRR